MNDSTTQKRDEEGPSFATFAALTPGGDIGQRASLVRQWEDFSNPPVYFTECKIKYWTNGDWFLWSTCHNRSGHSDWDVWVDLSIVTWPGLHLVANLGNQVWFQDLDHGELYGKTAKGYHSEIIRGWEHLQEDSWVALLNTHIRRDN